jgi:hypothetical protein
MEAVGFVYPIYDKLKMLNDCTVSVASPSRLIAKSKLKNDRIDAIALGELLIKDQLLTSYNRGAGKKLLAMERARYARRKARVVVEIKWLLKRRGIKVKGHDDLNELHLPEIDRRLR